MNRGSHIFCYQLDTSASKQDNPSAVQELLQKHFFLQRR